MKMKRSVKLMFSMILAVCLICTNIPTNIIAAEIDFNNSETTEVLEAQTGSTYYVKNNGNDDADGLSEANAWATLEKVNATTFQPGDSILLERGSVWNGQLWPKGSGNNTEGGYIRLGAYGTGNRPIINGNGTGAAKKEADNKNNPTNKQFISGAVMLVNQEYWVIENLEVTNSDKTYVSNKQGILVLNTAPTKSTAADANILNFIRIKNCYVHDVDTLDITDWETPYLNYGSSERHNNTHKMTGGITTLAWNAELNGVYKNGILNEDRVLNKSAGFNDVIIENNHVLRVSKEGIRTKSTQFNALTGFNESYPKKNSSVIIRNNYIEKVFGDAIVLSEVGSNGLVEHNVVNGHTFSSGANYAGVWTHYSNDSVVQYNEVFNGNNALGDGEGFDIDNSCYRNVFQYNYSHNNAGGLILFMTSQWDSVFRHNISTNDSHLAGQQTFYYSYTADDNKRPKIYNNTIYIGKDITVDALTATNKTSMDFQNNIILVHGTLKQLAGITFNENSIVKNNCFYPPSIAFNKGLTEAQTNPSTGNIFVDPKLVNVSTNSVREDDKYSFEENKQNNPEFFSNKDMLRTRVAKYKLSNVSPEELKTGGTPVLPQGAYPVTPQEDIFGNAINHTDGSKISMGAHQWLEAVDNGNIYIPPDTATVDNVEINKSETIVNIDGTEKLVATVTGGSELSDKSVSWTSSNPDIATVNADGVVKGISVGTTTITAISNRDNTKSAICTVTVPLFSVDRVDIDKLAMVMQVYDIKKLTAVAVGSGLTDTSVNWTSSDPTIATVENGNVNAIKPGNVTITATSNKDSSISATCDVIVAATDVVAFTATEDTYIRDNGTGPYGNEPKITIKKDDKGYNRHVLTKFTVPAGDYSKYSNVVLRLYMTSYGLQEGEDNSRTLRVHAIESDWNEDTEKYNSTNHKDIQANISNNLVYKEQGNSYIDLNITDYIKANPPTTEDKTYSFRIESLGPNPNGTIRDQKSPIDIASKESTEATGPRIVFESKISISDTTVSTIVGEAPILPTTVTASYSDNTTKELPVTWDNIEPDKYKNTGKFYVLGTVQGQTLKAVATVTVKNVTSFSPVEIESPKYMYPTLPKTITITYSDDTTEIVPVTWDTVPPNNYNNLNVGEKYFIQGTTHMGYKPKITVKQSEPITEIVKTIEASDIDNYSQNNSVATDNNVLKIKGSKTSGYGRQSYVKFNLDSLGFGATQANDAIIRVYPYRIDFANNFLAAKFNVYVLGDAESKKFVNDTWSQPLQEIPATHKVVDGMEIKYAATNKDDTSNMPEYIDIPIGDAVKYADSEGNITFKFICEEPPSTGNMDNGGMDFYSRNYQDGEKAPQLFVTNNYVTAIATTIEPIYTDEGIAPEGMPETVDVILKDMDDNKIVTPATGRRVIWDKPTIQQLATKVGGSYTLYGTVEGSNIRAEVEINVGSKEEVDLKKGIDAANAVLNDVNSTAQQVIKSIQDLSELIINF